MAKRLRRRLCRMLPSFGGLRSKSDAAATQLFDSDAPGLDLGLDVGDPSDAFLRESLVSPSCGCCYSWRRWHPGGLVLHPCHATPDYLWRKEDKWLHVMACPEAVGGGGGADLPTVPRQKIDSDDGVFPPLVLRRVRRRKVATRRPRPSVRFRSWAGSDSSADDGDAEEDDSEWFSSGNETRLMVSTSDVGSSGKMLRLRRRRRRRPKKSGRAAMSTKRCLSTTMRRTAVGTLIPFAAPAMRESFAVVKLSKDPEEDFRRSMAEMVVEKKIYDAQGLEQLLCCFLWLNLQHHHAAIVAAFKDIWDTLFPVQVVGNGGSQSDYVEH